MNESTQPNTISPTTPAEQSSPSPDLIQDLPEKKSKKWIFLALSGILLVALIVILILIFTQKDTAHMDTPPEKEFAETTTDESTFLIRLVPTDATAEIDGTTYTSGSYSLAPGIYTATIHADGFTDTTKTFSVSSDTVTQLEAYLTPTFGFYTSEDYRIMRYLTPDYYLTDLLQAYNHNLAIYYDLPFGTKTTSYFVESGTEDPSCIEPKLCLLIEETGDYDAAMSAIRDAGYDPGEYQLIYGTTMQKDENYNEE